MKKNIFTGKSLKSEKKKLKKLWKEFKTLWQQ